MKPEEFREILKKAKIELPTVVMNYIEELEAKKHKKRTVYSVHHVYQHDFDIEHRLVYNGSDPEKAFNKCYEYFQNIVSDTRKDYNYPFDDEGYIENENKKFTGLDIKKFFMDWINNAIQNKKDIKYSSRDDSLWDDNADGEEGGFELNITEV